MSKNLTFKHNFEYFRPGEETITALLVFDKVNDNGELDHLYHVHITEPMDREAPGFSCVKNYLVGPIVDRLHAFEEIGLEPKELKALVRYYRKEDYKRPEFLDKKFNV